MAGENSIGESITEPNEEKTVQILKLEAALSSERKRCADKDKQLQMMEALLGRLQTRLEQAEENLKEQRKKSGTSGPSVVLDLQQQLAEELAKRKQAQYALIEKGQELCNVQQKLAESQQRVKELLISKSAEKKLEPNKARCDDHGTHGSYGHGASSGPQLIITAASPSPKSPMNSMAPQSPCASRASSYAPVISPCATPKSPGDFKQLFPFPPKMMVPPLSLPPSGEKTSEWHHWEIPEISEVQPVFLECPLPHSVCNSGYHTPVHVQSVQVAQVDYPRILKAKLAQVAQDRIKPAVLAAQTARVVSAEQRSACVPPRALHSMPLARPYCESPRFST